MDEQLKKMLLDAAQKGINGVENAVNWISQQAPELLQEIILYNLIISCILVIIGLFLIIFASVFFKKNILTESYDSGPIILLPIFSFAAGAAVFAVNITTFIKCAFAPKLFIFEYVSNLIN